MSSSKQDSPPAKGAAERLAALEESVRSGASVTAEQMAKAQSEAHLEVLEVEADRRAAVAAAEAALEERRAKFRAEVLPALEKELASVRAAYASALESAVALLGSAEQFRSFVVAARVEGDDLGIGNEVVVPGPRVSVEGMLSVLARDAIGGARHQRWTDGTGVRVTGFLRYFFDSDERDRAENEALAAENDRARQLHAERIEARAAQRAEREAEIKSSQIAGPPMAPAKVRRVRVIRPKGLER